MPPDDPGEPTLVRKSAGARARRKTGAEPPDPAAPPSENGAGGKRRKATSKQPPENPPAPSAANDTPVPIFDEGQKTLPEQPSVPPQPASVADTPAQRQPRAGRRRWIIRVGALCLILAAIGGALLFRIGRAPVAAPAPAPLGGSLPIDVVKSARVGDTVAVTVGPVAAVDGLPATLTMVGSYGPRIYRSAFAGGSARFLIPGDDTHQSGTVALTATAGAARGDTQLTFEPGTPVEPITPLVGARSIIADTRHWSMSVVVPFDRFGNPVAEGTPVELRALHPDDQLELQHTQVRNLLAWARFFSRTRAGRTTVAATADGKHGPDTTFSEVPGWPAPFTLSASPANLPADGRQFVTLHTDVIRDEYGNAMLDGTLVTFVVETPDGEPRFIPAYTIDGVAKAQLQAPGVPGRLTMRAEVYDAESRPLQISFAAGPAVDSFAVAARVDATKQSIELVAGPMLGPQQQFIPDGTSVQFVLTDATGQQTHLDGVADSGYARVVARLAFLPLGAYTAEVAVGAGHGTTTFHVP
jgi:hypothetical protein